MSRLHARRIWRTFQIRHPIVASVVRPWIAVVLAVLVAVVTVRLPAALAEPEQSLHAAMAASIWWPSLVILCCLVFAWIRAIRFERWSAIQVMQGHLVSVSAFAFCVGVLALVPAWVNQAGASSAGNDRICRDGVTAFVGPTWRQHDPIFAPPLSSEQAMEVLFRNPPTSNEERLDALQLQHFQPLGQVTLRCENQPAAVPLGTLPADVAWYQLGDSRSQRLSPQSGSRGHGRPILLRAIALQESRFTWSQVETATRWDRVQLAEAYLANGDAVRGFSRTWLGYAMPWFPAVTWLQALCLLLQPVERGQRRNWLVGAGIVFGTQALCVVVLRPRILMVSPFLIAMYGQLKEVLMALVLSASLAAALMFSIAMHRVRLRFLPATFAFISLEVLALMVLPIMDARGHILHNALMAGALTCAALMVSLGITFHRNHCTALRA